MSSVIYFIVCLNLLYSCDQIISYSPYETWELRRKELDSMIHSITLENQDEYLAQRICPFWKLTYDEQLKQKQNSSIEVVDMIVKRGHNLRNLRRCQLYKIIPSPIYNAYRHKDEFYIGPGVDGNQTTVGCKIGALTLGKIFYVSPMKIVTIKESHKRVAKVYEDFCRSSHLPVSLRSQDGGHWNTLMVRSNEAGDVMASVTVKPKGYSYDTIRNERQKLKKYFFKRLPNITLYHQVCEKLKCTQDESPFTLLYGKQYLMETLNGYKFQITPDSTFPNNKLAASLYYKTIINMANLNSQTTILDLSSNTGTNSIIMSRSVREVVVFSSIRKAVTEAKKFEKFNNILNLKFVFGRTDDKLKSELNRLGPSSDVLVLVNYRLELLAPNVIRKILSSSQISQIVYVSYKPNSRKSIARFVDLCLSNNSNVPPFRLTKVIPIDLLPQTEYIDFILIFQREYRLKHSH